VVSKNGVSKLNKFENRGSKLYLSQKKKRILVIVLPKKIKK